MDTLSQQPQSLQTPPTTTKIDVKDITSLETYDFATLQAAQQIDLNINKLAIPMRALAN